MKDTNADTDMYLMTTNGELTRSKKNGVLGNTDEEPPENKKIREPKYTEVG